MGVLGDLRLDVSRSSRAHGHTLDELPLALAGLARLASAAAHRDPEPDHDDAECEEYPHLHRDRKSEKRYHRDKRSEEHYERV